MYSKVKYDRKIIVGSEIERFYEIKNLQYKY